MCRYPHLDVRSGDVGGGRIAGDQQRELRHLAFQLGDDPIRRCGADPVVEPAMVSVRRLNHAVLYVSDPAASAAFYGDLLGPVDGVADAPIGDRATAAEVEDWVSQAKDLPRMISY